MKEGTDELQAFQGALFDLKSTQRVKELKVKMTRPGLEGRSGRRGNSDRVSQALVEMYQLIRDRRKI